MKKLTLEDVGRLAGVSRATVSRVINQPESVSPERRARVQKVIRETGYQPNIAARSLASRRSNIIGLVIPSVARVLFSDPYFPSLIQGITRACNAVGYTLALFVFHSPEEKQQVYQRATGSGLVDGLLITAEKMDDHYLQALIDQEFPFVYIGRPAQTDRSSFVEVDNVAGAYMATNHLLRLGRERVALIGAPLWTTVGIDRRAGYVNAHADRGRPVREELMAYGDFTRDSGYAAMRQLLPYRPDAVFAASDTMAQGALQVLREEELRIPEDVAVVGFDDLPPATQTEPPLTTVRQPVARTGEIGVETLIDILDNGPEPLRQMVLPTQLIIRASCGAMPVD